MHTEVDAGLTMAFARVLKSGQFIMGPELRAFEEEFAHYCGTRHCVGVACGLDALTLSLRALKVGPGDEVILPANTFIATALAVSQVGAEPVLVDCREDDMLMDVSRVPDAITPRTAAIIPVHLYGQCANMEAILDIAEQFDLDVVEDAAQAHGAAQHCNGEGHMAGSMGDAGCVSFYPGKNLGALGDGGAVVTDNPEISEAVLAYRNYGQTEKYCHIVKGQNSRLDELQAAFLRVKLEHLDDWNRMRQRIARLYQDALRNIEGIILPVLSDNQHRHVWHQYVVRVQHRDLVMQGMRERGVACGIHYPVPIHLQMAYQEFSEHVFPNAEEQGQRVLSLPISPHMTAGEAAAVATALIQSVEAAEETCS